MQADMGVVGVLKGLRMEVPRKGEELGTARGSERSMLAGCPSLNGGGVR